MNEIEAELRLKIPFVEKAEIELKKIGLELIVKVGGYKRNIILPAAMGPFKPREARFESEALTISFTRETGVEAPRSENGRRTETAHEQV